METSGDSLDLVPIAAFRGMGKRHDVYCSYLLACYDNDKEEFESICIVATGFSEAMLEERYGSLRGQVITMPKLNYRYPARISPDVWLEPSEVWEVKAAELTIGPQHCAAIGVVHRSKGISIKCPRFLRMRGDKHPEEASSSDQVADMYKRQKTPQKTNVNVRMDD